MNYTDQESIYDTGYRIVRARENAPKDALTRLAQRLTKFLCAINLVFIPVQIVTTLVGGCLVALTLGLFALVMNLLWLPFLGVLLATSWIWLRVPLARPVLLLPGPIIAWVCDLLVMLLPDDRDSKRTKLALTAEWPLSWLLMRPLEDGEQPIGTDGVHGHSDGHPPDDVG